MSKPKEDDENVVSIEHDVTNEMIVLAAVLVDKKLREKYVLKESADNFLDDENALVWSAMQRVLRRKTGFDLQQVHKEVSGKVSLAYLKQLMATYPSPPVSMARHMQALRWDGTRARATQDVIPTFLRTLKDPSASPADVQSKAEHVAASLKAVGDGSFMTDPHRLAMEHRLVIEKRKSIACYEYGIHELDYFPDGTHRCIPGAAPGKITNITAPSGAGKSVLAAAIALEQARRGRRVLYGAWEMGDGPTIELMANMSFNTNPDGADPERLGSRYSLSTGALEEDELDTFQDRMDKIGAYIKFFQAPFSNEPWRKYTNEDALNELHRQIVDSGAEVVVYDLFERCLPDGAPGPERRALFGLQNIHSTTGAHCIMCTQQKTKDIENRTDKRPTRSTILGSQAWVDVSDTIIGVHRPALWKPIKDDTVEFYILKQRFGKWPMAIQFKWDGERGLYTKGRDIDFEQQTDGGGFF